MKDSMLYQRPNIQQLEQDVINFKEKEMNKDRGVSWDSGLLAEHNLSLKEQIEIERENMLQAIFPSWKIRHGIRLAELEQRLEESDARKDHAKRIADLEERSE